MMGVLGRLVNPPLFVVALNKGTARAKKGNLSQAFLNDCSSIARDQALSEGEIYGVRRRQGIGLEFSRHIPSFCHQRFRNTWGVHRGHHQL